MNILKNYILKSELDYENYLGIEIQYNTNLVYENLPICIIPQDVVYLEPVILSITQKGFARIIERKDLITRVNEDSQRVYFEFDASNQLQIVQHETKIFTRLPIEDNPNDYIYDYYDGEIYVLDAHGV